jgi:hypothetical protein
LFGKMYKKMCVNVQTFGQKKMWPKRRECELRGVAVSVNYSVSSTN